MRITREQLYAAFDITDPSVIFVDFETKDDDIVYFYKDGKQDCKVKIRWDGRINN